MTADDPTEFFGTHTLSKLPPVDEQAIGNAIDLDRVRRRDLLGGLIHEYQLAA